MNAFRSLWIPILIFQTAFLSHSPCRTQLAFRQPEGWGPCSGAASEWSVPLIRQASVQRENIISDCLWRMLRLYSDWEGSKLSAPEDSDQNVKFSPLFVADVCVREKRVGPFSLKEQRPAPSYKQGLRITEYRWVSSEIPVCMQEAGDSRNITLEMKTWFSSANAWRLEKPLGSFDFKWGLFPREKSAAHLCKHMGRREEIARAGWLYQPAVKSKVEKSTL